MNKPISVIIADMRKAIEDAAAESRLPAAILEPIFETYLYRIQEQARAVEMREAMEWAENKDSTEEAE